MSTLLLRGDVMECLAAMKDESVQMVITSPPYWGLRDYKIAPQIWGGASDCQHEWTEQRWYTEQSAGANGAAAFSKPGPANAARLKEARWRTAGLCEKCTAWRGSLGLEPSPELYVEHLVSVFREIRRVLRSDGTLWLNIGDSYASGKGTCFNPGGGKNSLSGHKGLKDEQAYPLNRGNKSTLAASGLKPKDKVGIPHMVVFALRSDGWWWRDEIIWHKPNPMPGSQGDRCTVAHEFVFMLTKKARYFYDQEAIKEPVSGTGDYKTPDGWDTSAGQGAHGSFVKQGREKGHKDWKPSHLRPKNHGANSRMNKDRDPAHNEAEHKKAAVGGITRTRRSVWEIATAPYPDAHFATFPEALVEPCILAGTSARGACPTCRTPWERVIEKGLTEHDGETESAYEEGSTANRLALLRQAARERGEEYVNATETIGWQPTCKCGIEATVPCIVLDPFAGSGTVLAVAQRLGRKAIGSELNPDYCQLVKKRTDGQTIGLAF